MANENLKKVLHELCEFTPSNYDIDDILKAVKLDELQIKAEKILESNRALERMETLLDQLGDIIKSKKQ